MPFLLSSQSLCICAGGKVLMLIGAHSDEENHDDLDIEASTQVQIKLHLVKDCREPFTDETSLLDRYLNS